MNIKAVIIDKEEMANGNVSHLTFELEDGTSILHFTSIPAAAKAFLEVIDIEECEALAKINHSDLEKFHMSYGQWIRNAFNLWEEHCPLTPYQPMIIDGVDHSPTHPDAVSQKILHAARDMVEDYLINYKRDN